MDPVLIELPMPITTPRLIIRPPKAGDGAAVDEAVQESLKELRPWIPFSRSATLTAEEAEASCRKALAKFILREDIRLHMYDRGTGQFVGSTGLHRVDWNARLFEVGYWIRTSRARQGLVTEAANAITRYAFQELAARRVSLFCNAENAPSADVARRLGFQQEGRLRNWDRFAADEVVCRDELVFARVSPDGLPPLEVSW
jgi:ribosomal-protein-serine acetyltransferase